MFISIREIRERRATGSRDVYYGVNHAVMQQNVDELVQDGEYFPVYMPQPLQGLGWHSDRKELVNWLETNVVPIFSDLEAGKGEFDRLEDRNKELLAKWLEFVEFFGDEPQWIYVDQCAGGDYPNVSQVLDLGNNIQMLGAYYSRCFANVVSTEVDLTLGFGTCCVPFSFSYLQEKDREKLCCMALGPQWPDWLNVRSISNYEPDLGRLSRRKRLCWSIMCFMVTVGVVGETLHAEGICYLARRVVHIYSDLLLFEEND